MSAPTEVHEGSDVLSAYGSALADAAAAAHTGPREQLGQHLVRTFVRHYEDPQLSPKLLGLFQSAMSGGEGAEALRQFMTTQLFAQVGQSLGMGPMNSLEEAAAELKVPPIHLNAAAAQVWGVVMLRYILRIEPMASASEDEIVDLLAPTIQRYLVG
jgi:hypothetical protein